MMTTSRLRTLTAAMAGVGMLLVPGRAHAVPSPGDAYMCYTATVQRPSPFPKPATLQDQLGGPQGYNATKVVSVCNPANASGIAPLHPIVHQLNVHIRAQSGAPTFVPTNHVLDDQFGNRTLTFTAPDTLFDVSATAAGTGGATALTPTQSGSVDRFQCYKARPLKHAPKFVPPPSPTVTDDFFPTGQTFNLKKVTDVCTPTAENSAIAGAPGHNDHLLCYRVALPKGAPKFAPIQISANSVNFGPMVLTVKHPAALCVPAMMDANCDFLDPSTCMYPFPNDWFTVADSSTGTGRRVNFLQSGMPSNSSYVPISAADDNLNDGFSQGASILVHVPNVDPTVTGMPPITNIAASLVLASPTVIVNASTLALHPHWAEIDSNASSPATQSLIIRPAVSLSEGQRYIVALRNMRDSSGNFIPPNRDFLAYRDNIPTGDPYKEARRAHMEDLFTTLTAAGIDRSTLYLAWDFTVASTQNTTGRLLFARDDAFTRLGTNAPSFTVTNVLEHPCTAGSPTYGACATDADCTGGGAGSCNTAMAGIDSNIFRRVVGTYNVERYVDSTTPPARMILDSNGLPIHQSTPQPASFICNIPYAALPSDSGPAVPARAAIYGHGLLGSNSEVDAGNVEAMGQEHNFVFCATKWLGMSDEDIPTAIGALQNLSNFPNIADRLQQGMVDQLYLARLMIHAQGFVSDPAFQDASSNPVIDTGDVFYDGNSQGGIFGGTVMAIAQDITRGVLGVPGMNYSLLLTRSTDWALYSAILYPAYPDELTRPLDLALIQMLWDRSDPNGYAQHITSNPLPNTPVHKVLLHLAVGDHQVANVATQVEARTIGAYVHQPAIAAGRDPDVTPYWGIPPIPSDPFDGSALIVWDSGANPPPITNTAPPSTGFDPHGDPRSDPGARQQKSDFLQTGGTVTDVCADQACLIPHY